MNDPHPAEFFCLQSTLSDHTKDDSSWDAVMFGDFASCHPSVQSWCFLHRFPPALPLNAHIIM